MRLVQVPIELAKSRKRDLRYFRETISSIRNGGYDDDYTGGILQVVCENIQKNVEIAMTLYPENSRPQLKLYAAGIADCLQRIDSMQESAGYKEKRSLNVVYDQLQRLCWFIMDLLLAGISEF